MKKELMDMAKEAGFFVDRYGAINDGLETTADFSTELEAFGALVSAADRERILAVIGDNQCECRCAEVVRARGETK